ncbi:MAG TPA: hypothetical protein VHG93_03315, partial [Longimicrobium sp.]|nr:hypothetical protein [Longimicrobium sp.]
MQLFSHDTLVIDSPLPPGEACTRTRQATGAPRFLGLGKPAAPFEGEVVENEIRIERAIGYQNGWLAAHPRPHLAARGGVPPYGHDVAA